MAATNKTTNYELPIFIGTDKPTWLGDWNQAMNAIDAAIKSASNAAATATQTANAAQTTAEGVQTQVTTLNGTVTQLQSEVTDAMGDISSLEADVTSLQNKINGLPSISFFSSPGKTPNGNDFTLQGFQFNDNTHYLSVLSSIMNLQNSTPPVIASQIYQIGAISGNPLNLPSAIWNGSGGVLQTALIGYLTTPRNTSSIFNLMGFYDSAHNTTLIMVFSTQSDWVSQISGIDDAVIKGIANPAENSVGMVPNTGVNPFWYS